jgi:hypothetical protein
MIVWLFFIMLGVENESVGFIFVGTMLVTAFALIGCFIKAGKEPKAAVLRSVIVFALIILELLYAGVWIYMMVNGLT